MDDWKRRLDDGQRRRKTLQPGPVNLSISRRLDEEDWNWTGKLELTYKTANEDWTTRIEGLAPRYQEDWNTARLELS